MLNLWETIENLLEYHNWGEVRFKLGDLDVLMNAWVLLTKIIGVKCWEGCDRV